jgi:hypothetical protein
MESFTMIENKKSDASVRIIVVFTDKLNCTNIRKSIKLIIIHSTSYI